MRIPNWAGSVPRETQTQLERYVLLLEKWNAKINLIARDGDIWPRHIWDSYQLVDLIPSHVNSIIDLGSGAGLPGIILAIAKPDLKVTLVERDQRKAAFLREAVRELDLKNISVIEKDAKEIDGNYDLVTSRALAALDELCSLSAPLMGVNAICLFPKGENFASELSEAGKGWSFEHRLIPSKTHDKSFIVSLSKLKSMA